MRTPAALALLVAALAVAAPAGFAGGPAAADQAGGPATANRAATPAVDRAASPTADAAGAATGTHETFVVGGDGSYDAVQAAVDDAGDGDVVVLRPGTYEQTVTVDVSVTLVAPEGATLDGSGLPDDAAAITVEDGAAPTIRGVTVAGYAVGIDAARTGGDWVVADSDFRGFVEPGVDQGVAIDARNATGDWRLRNVTVRDSEVGVDAWGNTGRWRVENSTFRDNEFGVEASHSTGRWAVRNSTFTGHRDGVKAWYAAGDWVVADSDFRFNREGVYATHTVGDWVVVDSTFRNNTYNAVDAHANSGDWRVLDSVFLANRFAINAEGTAGEWAVHRNVFVASDRTAVWALGAERDGDATRNWWGNASGQDVDDCIGNVDCSDHLTEPPVDDPAYVGRSDGDAWNATPVRTISLSEDEPMTPTADEDSPGRDLGSLAGAGLLLALAVGAIGGPILYVRRYGLQ